MKHGLAGAWANVKHRAVAIFDAALAGDPRRHDVQIADVLRVFRLRVLDVNDVSFRNDEHVSGSLRADIFEGEGAVVLVNLLRLRFTANDAAEETVHSNC